MIVRLKDHKQHALRKMQCAFQFYDSPIKRHVHGQSGAEGGCFNSMIVRLKAFESDIRATYAEVSIL